MCEQRTGTEAAIHGAACYASGCRVQDRISMEGRQRPEELVAETEEGAQ